MNYDEKIPEKLDDNEIVIYEDTKGNIDTDQYLKKGNVESFKAYLTSIGFKVYYSKDPDSFDVGRPFRYGKPFVQKRSTREIDWTNEAVIVEALMSRATSSVSVKKMVEISGKVAIQDSKATGFTLDARYRFIDTAFQKWKSEQKKDETPENRKELITAFAKIYCEEERIKRQKRIAIGSNVLIVDEGKKGEITAYDGEDGKYTIKTEDGFHSRYKRKEFEVI